MGGAKCFASSRTTSFFLSFPASYSLHRGRMSVFFIGDPVSRTPPRLLTFLLLHHVPAVAQTILDLSVPSRTCSAMMSLRCHHCSAAFHRCSICFLFRVLLLTVAPQRPHQSALVWFPDSVYKSVKLAHVTPDLFWLNHQLNLLHFTFIHNS